jgi:signal transduction histidine kinase/PAS domain-containing protein
MKLTATQQPLVVLALGAGANTGTGELPTIAAEIERQGSIILPAATSEDLRRTMSSRDSDLLVVVEPDGAAALGVRDAVHEAGYRSPVILVCPAIDDEAAGKIVVGGRDLVVSRLDNVPELVRSWLVLGRMHQQVRRFEREIPARAEEMDDLRRFTDGLIASLPTGLFIVSDEMQVLFANRSALRDGTGDARNLVGRPLAQVVPVASAGSPFAQAVRRVIETSEPSRLLGLRLPAATAGGPGAIVNVDIAPCRLGVARCARVMLNDVTEEWQAEQGRLREAWKLQTVVDAIGAGLAILDKDLRFTWINRAFKQWFGSAIGRPCDEVCSRGNNNECVACPAQSALTSGQAETATWKRVGADGKRRVIQATFMSLPEGGGAASLIMLALDVSEQANRLEQMQIMERISESVQGVLKLHDLLQVILTCVTTGQALGFNRAFLFLRNRAANTIDGQIAVGPASAEEAGRIWGELASRQGSLEDALRDATATAPASHPLGAVLKGVSYPLTDDTQIPVRVFNEKRFAIVRNAATDPRVTSDFFARFGAREFVAVPLVSKGVSLGVVIADNLYNNRPIADSDIALLQLFCSTAGLAIENAEAFADLRDSINTLRSTRRQLIDQTKLAAIGRVAAHLAHEIRNPLATIGGFAHAINGRPDSIERVKMSSSIIYQEVMRLERMLSGIMDFSRPARPVLVAQSLNDIVIHAVDIMASQLPRNVKVYSQLDGSLKDLSFDAAQIQQVIINLVKNAVEAMGEKGGSIAVATAARGEYAELTVRDDGPGIPKELHSKVFEPFYTTKKGGTGLGLAVCRHIVAEHGGQIHLESAPSNGTTIRITLPCAPPRVSGELDVDEDLP